MDLNEYNLDFFRESANGDVKFMKYILNLTARELQDYFNRFAEALQNGDIEQARRAKHKLHPHLEALQAYDLQKLAEHLINESERFSPELLQTFQQKATLLCNAIQQAANDEK